MSAREAVEICTPASRATSLSVMAFAIRCSLRCPDSVRSDCTFLSDRTAAILVRARASATRLAFAIDCRSVAKGSVATYTAGAGDVAESVVRRKTTTVGNGGSRRRSMTTVTTGG